jgi:hypothetical protein
VKCFVKYLYGRKPHSHDPISERTDRLLNHIEVYDFAEKYEIRGLMKIALGQFYQGFNDLRVCPGFLKIVHRVYEKKLLWEFQEIVARTLYWNVELSAMTPDVMEVIRTYPDIAVKIGQYRYLKAPSRLDMEV